MNNRQWIPKIEKGKKSICTAIAEALEEDIAKGILNPNEKLPPQRELADSLGVNLSTVTRAFRLCELKGLIYGVVGRGTFVSSDARVSLSLMEKDSNELIDMGQVLPLYSFDKDTAKTARTFLQDMDMERLIRYSEPQGHLNHRAVGAEWLRRFNINSQAEGILITPGSQSAIANCLLTLFKYGDRIAVDSLTYPGFKSLVALYGIRLVPIDMTDSGMSVQGLLNACKNEGIKGIYLMPEVQNPTTGFMSKSCREQISEIIRKYNLILMEDDAYAYTGNPKSVPISAHVPEHGIYMGGTSKLLGPGFRISFVKIPKTYMEPMKRGILNTTWMASPITAEIVTRLITSGRADAVIREKRDEAKKRNKLALEMLSGYKIAYRACGFFQWLFLTDNWQGQGRAFELLAREAGVQVFCAEKFVVGSSPVPQAIRISLTGPYTIDMLEKGLCILKNVLQKEYQPEFSML